MSPNKMPAYKPLPPLGSEQRTELIETLSKAFGSWNPDRPGAVDSDKIYDILSQLSYHDRITLCHQVFRHQKHPDFVEKGRGVSYSGDPEMYVRHVLLTRLSTDKDNESTFRGAHQFLQLMSDSPQGPYHTKLMNGHMSHLKKQTFADKKYDSVIKPLALLNGYDPGYSYENDPSRVLKSMGIMQAKPPFRTKDPLGETDAPQYATLPAEGTNQREELVAQLIKAMGKPRPFEPGLPRVKVGTLPSDPTFGKDFKGFDDPNTVLRLLGQFDYKTRLELYREVLSAVGEKKRAGGSDYEIRQSLMFHFMYSKDQKKNFTGLQQYFQLIADAPRTHENEQMLRDEVCLLDITRTDLTKVGKEFDDKDDETVAKNFKTFFNIGGFHKDFLPFDFYNRLELIGIPVGKPPVVAPSSPSPSPAPAPIPLAVAPGGMTSIKPAIGGLLNGDSLGFPLPPTDSEIDRLHPVITHMRPLQPLAPVSV